MSEVRGIVLYNIEMDACLNGVYTNSHPDTWGNIATETARLINQYPENGIQVFEYDCFYFDNPIGNGVQCKLVFKKDANVYKVHWELNGKTLFAGEGFQMNDRQIAISYWSVT